MCQSGFKTHHSTETVLLQVMTDIRSNLDNKSSALVLDSSYLSEHISLSGIVLNWITHIFVEELFLHP